jgi:hypothetical protein
MEQSDQVQSLKLLTTFSVLKQWKTKSCISHAPSEDVLWTFKIIYKVTSHRGFHTFYYKKESTCIHDDRVDGMQYQTTKTLTQRSKYLKLRVKYLWSSSYSSFSYASERFPRSGMQLHHVLNSSTPFKIHSTPDIFSHDIWHTQHIQSHAVSQYS